MAKQEEIAEFIGIMLGDGCIGVYDCKSNGKTKKQYQLKVTLDSRNKQYTEYVFNLMDIVLGVKPVIYFKTKENTVDIRIFRKEIFNYATKELGLNLSPKWNKAKIPEKYQEGKLALFVLRGLFDTDGSVTIFNNNGRVYPRMEIKICPSPMQKQVIEILNNNDFSYRVEKLERGKIRIRLSGIKQLARWFSFVGSSNRRYIKRADVFLKKKVL